MMQNQSSMFKQLADIIHSKNASSRNTALVCKVYSNLMNKTGSILVLFMPHTFIVCSLS